MRSRFNAALLVGLCINASPAFLNSSPAMAHAGDQGAAVPTSSLLTLTSSDQLSDRFVQELLLTAGLDLTALWETHVALALAAAEEDALTAACDASDASLLSPELSDKLAQGLAAIAARINSQTPSAGLPAPLLKALAAYFSIDALKARISEGDELILDRPSTPLMIHHLSQGEKALSSFTAFQMLAQNSYRFKQAEGERYTPTAAESFVNPSIAKGLCYYLMLSSSSVGIPLLKRTLFQEDFYPDGLVPRPYSKDLVVLDGFPLELPDHTELKGILTPFDDSHRSFQGAENQGAHGTCWLFAAKRLAEEQVCRNRTSAEPCDVRLSTYDISRNHWTFLTPSEGGYPRNAMQTAINGGVCLDKFAPYLTPHDEVQLNKALTEFALYTLDHPDTCPNKFAWKDVTLPSNHTLELSDELLGIIERFEKRMNHDDNPFQVTLAGNYSQQQHQKLGQLVLGGDLGESRDILANFDRGTDHAIRDTLIGEACRRNRIAAPFAGLATVETFFPEEMPVLERLQKMMEMRATTGHSIGLYICARSYQGGKQCGNHAIEMDGVRHNPSTKQWEGHFVNSWGSSTVLNGWIKIDKVFRYVYGIFAFKDVPASSRLVH